jgi:hypothetical protein
MDTRTSGRHPRKAALRADPGRSRPGERDVASLTVSELRASLARLEAELDAHRQSRSDPEGGTTLPQARLTDLRRERALLRGELDARGFSWTAPDDVRGPSAAWPPPPWV